MKKRSKLSFVLFLAILLLSFSFSTLSNLDYGIFSRVIVESRVNSIKNYSKDSFLYFHFYKVERGIAWAKILFNLEHNKEITVENTSSISKTNGIITLIVEKVRKGENRFYMFKIIGGYDEDINLDNKNKITFWNDRVIMSIGYQNISKFPSVFNLWVNLSILSYINSLKIKLDANNSRFINLSILNVSCNQNISILKKENRSIVVSVENPLENLNCLFKIYIPKYNISGSEEVIGKYYVLANLCNVTVTYYRESDNFLEKLKEIFLPLDSKILVYKNASSTYDGYTNWSFLMNVPDFSNSKCWIEYSVCTNESECFNNKNIIEVNCKKGKLVKYSSDKTPIVFFKLLNVSSNTSFIGKYIKVVNVTFKVYPAILTTYFILAEKNYTLISENPIIILARVKICNEGLTSVGRVCYVEFLPKDILNESSIYAFKNGTNVSYSFTKKYNFIDGNYAYIFCFNKIESNSCINLVYNLTPRDPNLIMGLKSMYFIGVDPSLILSKGGFKIKIIEDMEGKIFLKSLGDLVIYLFLIFIFLIMVSRR